MIGCVLIYMMLGTAMWWVPGLLLWVDERVDLERPWDIIYRGGLWRGRVRR